MNYRPTCSKSELYVNEIVFFSRNDISLFGFVKTEIGFTEVQYLISRNDLRILLSKSAIGLEVLWQIEGLFLVPHEVPATINLIDRFGTTQIFEADNLLLELPNKKAQPQAGDVLFISSVNPVL